jgi:hypothetical protein
MYPNAGPHKVKIRTMLRTRTTLKTRMKMFLLRPRSKTLRPRSLRPTSSKRSLPRNLAASASAPLLLKMKTILFRRNQPLFKRTPI